ncbi:exosome complex component RRP40 [Sitodiplosis mosellana]|uniref:exosome complex component RRP40 n=1 Tax=Sitodiplosis mosellana TaxID=263140 RepID=UPI0024446F88|nr:exosome complex component RRP40 [Sitodiplosis mosellana]
MTNQVGDVVLPGDELTLPLPEQSKRKVLLGPGLRQQDGKVFAAKAGILKQKSTNTFWVDAIQKRYIPCKGETVIGLVVQKAGDIFRVEIGSNELAALSYLAFEGATKKNRPDVNIGDLVFAKLLVAHKDFESELICVDSMGKKQKLGVLREGFVFNCSINLARRLRSTECPLLESIKKHIQVPVEIVVGMNGRVWVNARRERDIIAVGNAILAAEFKTDDEIDDMCDQVGARFSGVA